MDNQRVYFRLNLISNSFIFSVSEWANQSPLDDGRGGQEKKKIGKRFSLVEGA